MTLIYQSTRDATNTVTASQAILKGLADDGGLFTPTDFPELDLDFASLKDASYQEIAKLVLGAFLDDFTEDELDSCIKAAYDSKFDTKEIASVVKLGDQYHLELFHGSTIAFKDMALSILPHLLTTAAKKQGVTDKIVILTATSGDTGKAAMAGFSDVKGTEIIVFYPKNGVSKIQELQMVTQTGNNTHVIAIDGNFDDAQTEVKRLFNDKALKDSLAAAGQQFSSANSMNIGRLIPQVVYYVYAYARLVAKGEIRAGQAITVSVPTGNFGNILAAYYAYKIGLPIKQLICASNENRVLTDFFTTKIYDKNRPFKVTSSPSMDILVSSNLERLIFHLLEDNAEETKRLMTDLNRIGSYDLTDLNTDLLNLFVAGSASEAETELDIKRLYEATSYVQDPHTAVAAAVYQDYLEKTQDTAPGLIVSTASPYKFPRVVVKAITGQDIEDDFQAVASLHELSKIAIPEAVCDLEQQPIRHQTVIATKDMQQAVEERLGLQD